MRRAKAEQTASPEPKGFLPRNAPMEVAGKEHNQVAHNFRPCSPHAATEHRRQLVGNAKDRALLLCHRVCAFFGVTTFVKVVFGILGGTAVVLKLHKYFVLGGSWFSRAAVVVVAEDLVVFLALFATWRLARAGAIWCFSHQRCNRFLRHSLRSKLLTVAHVTALIYSVVYIIAFLGAEHLYFWSTRSLLDGDALRVVAKSFKPILFIALQIEDRRGAQAALVIISVIAAGLFLAYRVRKSNARRRGRRETPLPSTTLDPVASLRRELLLCLLGVLLAELLFIFGDPGDYHFKILKRNCFVGVALDLRNTPRSGGGERWASTALQEVSCRVRGFLGAGVDGDAVHSSSKTGTKNEQGSGVAHGPQGQYAAPSARGSGANVLIVVLESTSGIYVTPTNDFGVSPWAEELSRRGMSSTKFYSSMPNTNKAMFQILCGMTPSLETSWVEFDQPDVLHQLCLPGLLRSNLGYESLLLTASMVGGLGVFGFDNAVGYAKEDIQGGRKAFRSRKIHEEFSFPHGTFEKVNYLGYDDHVVLNRSISFLLGEDASGGTDRDPARVDEDERGKLLTILTVGPHPHHDVPKTFASQDLGPSVGEGAASELLRMKYLNALRYQDTFLKNLYRELDASGLSENTYVIVVGDHGEAFEEHDFNKHGNNVYQEGIHVPFFITSPRGSESAVQPGARFDRTGMHADISPTILDLLGLWRSESERDFVCPPRQRTWTPGASQDSDQGLTFRRGRVKEPRVDKGNAGRTHGNQIPEELEGMIGDSLFGVDLRACTVSATHYGGKTIAVVAGPWKGVFMYFWEKRAHGTVAEVVNAQLFALEGDPSDPRETSNLLEVGAGGCCGSAPSGIGEATRTSHREGHIYPGTPSLSQSCRAAANLVVGVDKAREACCHLQMAAISFATNSLRFFGRQ